MRISDWSSDVCSSDLWTTLGEYLEFLAARGVTPNVASFVGATTVRIHELGEDDVDPTPERLARMQDLVRVAMGEGALGVGASLIYPPAAFRSEEHTSELQSLMRISYAVFCLKKKKHNIRNISNPTRPCHR